MGLVPIENSTEGNVKETIREVIRSNLMILGEKILPIHVFEHSATSEVYLFSYTIIEKDITQRNDPL